MIHICWSCVEKYHTPFGFYLFCRTFTPSIQNLNIVKVTHVYNPEHDLAMAYGGEGFTPPAAGRGMRAGLGFLPAFWAGDGDFVLVDDVMATERAAQRFREYLPKVIFVSWSQLPEVVKSHAGIDIKPWGWDMALRHQLLRAGVPSDCLPKTEDVERVRMLSHRRTAIPLLRHLVDALPDMVGERHEAKSLEEVRQWLSQEGAVVCKSPWSCSGRGVRFVETMLDANLEGFLRNVLAQQGSIIVEHRYLRLMDFAMEFMADEGEVRYEGLSLFDTRNGAYSGNMLATEDEKWAILEKMIPSDIVRPLILALEAELEETFAGYQGPLGVDMMVVEENGCRKVHPCVEVNMRRTMGWAALVIAQRTRGRYDTMRVVCQEGQYHLCLENKKDNHTKTV